MSKQTIWYSVGAAGHDSRYSILVGGTYSLVRPEEQEEIARLCAADYHANHGGWECSWPIEFRLYDAEDGQALARLSVDQDVQPVFYATHQPIVSAQ